MNSFEILTVWYKSDTELDNKFQGWIDAIKNCSANVGILVATNSPHGFRPEVRVGSPKLGEATICIEFRQNVGFAKACNELAQMATTDWLFFLNPDVALSSGDLDEINRAVSDMENEGHDVAAISMRTGKREQVGIRFGRLGMFVDCDLKHREKVIGPSGGAMLIRRKTFIELGGFRESLFMWGEDVDFALTLLKKNTPIKVIDLRLNHEGGHSITQTEDRLKKAFFMARNRLLLIRGRYSLQLQRRHLPIVLTVMIVNLALRKFPQGLFLPYLEGIKAGLQEPVQEYFSDEPPRVENLNR